MLAALVLLREVDRINARQVDQGRPGNISTDQFDEKFNLVSKLNAIVCALQSLGQVFPIVGESLAETLLYWSKSLRCVQKRKLKK